MSTFYFRYAILPDIRLVTTCTRGTIVITHYLDEFKKIVRDPLFTRNIHYLHDLRGVEDIIGTLSEHENFADFSVSISSSEATNVVFIINSDAAKIKKLVEGYCLMACRSNRRYLVFYESELKQALRHVGLTKLPTFVD